VSSWFAVSADGAARRVSGLGLVIGRAVTCDVVIGEPEVSRRHVLLQFGASGQLDIVPLPSAQTLVNGVAIAAPVAAKDGDVLTFPGGATLRLACSGDEAMLGNDHAWLFDVRGRRIGLRRESLVIGGGDDDVMLETWPAAAAQLTWRGEQPWLEARVDGLSRNAAALPRDTPVALAAGDRVAFAGVAVTLVTEAVDAAVTYREAPRMTSIELEMQATGGMVTVRTTRGEHHALLAERRFALLMTLLRPPAPYAAGGYVPDEVVFAAVWPRSDAVARGDVNQLVTRLRSDLRAAGLAGSELVERYPKGGSTRFVVAHDVVISVRS
jgi:hypothetical protein